MSVLQKNHSNIFTTTLAGFAGFILLFFAVPAQAQFEAGNWEVGFTVGAVEFDDNVKEGSSTEPYVTVRLGYFFTDHFELEIQRGDTVNVSSPDLETIFVNGVWNFRTEDNIVPYVLAGAGVADLSLGFPFFNNSVSDDSEAFQLAAGARIMFTDQSRWGLRFELTSIFEDTFDESSNHLALSGGFTFRIGS